MVSKEKAMELAREMAEEQRLEPLRIWIGDNKADLLQQFADEHEDEFDAFCLAEFTAGD